MNNAKLKIVQYCKERNVKSRFFENLKYFLFFKKRSSGVFHLRNRITAQACKNPMKSKSSSAQNSNFTAVPLFTTQNLEISQLRNLLALALVIVARSLYPGQLETVGIVKSTVWRLNNANLMQKTLIRTEDEQSPVFVLCMLYCGVDGYFHQSSRKHPRQYIVGFPGFQGST